MAVMRVYWLAYDLCPLVRDFYERQQPTASVSLTDIPGDIFDETSTGPNT